jgi:hypothetical protein
MSIIEENAAEAIHLVEEAAQRSKALRGYQSAAPHLILWGVIYAVAYSGTYFQPDQTGLVWLVLVPSGVIGDVLISRRDRTCNWALLTGPFLTFFAFVAATISIMHPRDGGFPSPLIGMTHLLLLTLTALALAWLNISYNQRRLPVETSEPQSS